MRKQQFYVSGKRPIGYNQSNLESSIVVFDQIRASRLNPTGAINKSDGFRVSLPHLRCVSNGDTTVLHLSIDIFFCVSPDSKIFDSIVMMQYFTDSCLYINYKRMKIIVKSFYIHFNVIITIMLCYICAGMLVKSPTTSDISWLTLLDRLQSQHWLQS